MTSTVDVLAYAELDVARSGCRCGHLSSSDLRGPINHPFLRVKLELQGRDCAREDPMPLSSRADVDRYMALSFPEHLFPPELAARIHFRTEGNPPLHG